MVESDYVPLPDYNEIGAVKKGTETSRTVQEQRKVIRWKEAEHRLFLQGLENHGWGNWRSISSNCVVTRTPTQVASHAQKYKIHQNSKEKKKERKRSSIHDVTHVKKDDISAPQGPITGQASGSAASSSGQSAEQAPPSPPAGIYAAPRIEHSIGGPLVSAVGTPVNLTPAGHMAYELGPDSETVMPGEPINLGPMTYPMQYTYAQPHYVDLIDDVNHIESGYVPLPDYNERRAVKKGTETSRTVQERRKVVRWTEAEHRLFLQGLKNHGWGDWRSISKKCVITRTPTQVASHAQKYKIHQNSKEKKKERKPSRIHDVTHVKKDDISAPQGPITDQAAASSSGQSAEQAPPSLVSAVGTPVNLTAAGQLCQGNQ
ncbi:hypothetical protein TSUD_189080 [Trifolium subterraneum]|uniref:HTH myb-type domain-containing protein n=1 Tax=Trifolium subterraneum TaxID=3900 RepID=A0A2Z6P2D6_TRISU|nr:hypothetical protein TSUD_189080 [Trifolium subterraneum]